MKNKQDHTQLQSQKTPCAWIELIINPDDFDISGFPKTSEVLNESNLYSMMVQAKEELIESHQKTLKWQKKAILNSFPTD